VRDPPPAPGAAPPELLSRRSRVGRRGEGRHLAAPRRRRDGRRGLEPPGRARPRPAHPRRSERRDRRPGPAGGGGDPPARAEREPGALRLRAAEARRLAGGRAHRASRPPRPHDRGVRAAAVVAGPAPPAVARASGTSRRLTRPIAAIRSVLLRRRSRPRYG